MVNKRRTLTSCGHSQARDLLWPYNESIGKQRARAEKLPQPVAKIASRGGVHKYARVFLRKATVEREKM